MAISYAFISTYYLYAVYSQSALSASKKKLSNEHFTFEF